MSVFKGYSRNSPNRIGRTSQSNITECQRHGIFLKYGKVHCWRAVWQEKKILKVGWGQPARDLIRQVRNLNLIPDAGESQWKFSKKELT